MYKNINNCSSKLLIASILGVLISFTRGIENANAQPHSSFQPILQELKSLLPANSAVRLPKGLFILDADEKEMIVYPTVELVNNDHHRSKVIIKFGTTPDCNNFVCYTGVHISAAPLRTVTDFYHRGTRRGSSITLKPDVRGRYFGNCFDPYDPIVGSRGRRHKVVWEQDNMLYEAVEDCPSVDRTTVEKQKENLIRRAISMAKNEPILSFQ